MSHLDEQIAEALTHGPDTLTYILAQEVMRLRGMIQDVCVLNLTEEEAEMACQIFNALPAHDRLSWFRGPDFAPDLPDLLRANQGGAAT